MREHRQWLCWRLVPRENQKPTKIPYSPITGLLASVTDPNTWATFAEAVAASVKYSGIGFVFTKNDYFCGIDLDDTSNAIARALQSEIFKELNSYSERSPSGRGLHIVVKAELPGIGRRRGSIELYDNKRFFTMTGDVFHNVPIAERQIEVEARYNQMGAPPQEYKHGEDQKETHTDENILEIAANAANGEKFSKLYAGKWGEFYKSQSEADFALIDIIGFYTQNEKQVVRLFRASELGKREKEKRDNYVYPMVKKAVMNELQLCLPFGILQPNFRPPCKSECNRKSIR